MFVSLLLVFLICAAGSFTQAAVGFGSNIIIMALLPLFLTPVESIAVALMCSVVLSGILTWRFRKKISWRLMLLPMIFSATGIVLGLILGAGISSGALRRLLGALLILLAIWQVRFASRLKIPIGPVSGSLTGIISCGLGALFAISAPPVLLYYGCALDEKEYYMGTLQATFFIQNLCLIPARMALGLWPWSAWVFIAPCLLGLAAGYLPGRMVFDRLDAAKFRLAIYIFMFMAGIYMIVCA